MVSTVDWRTMLPQQPFRVPSSCSTAGNTTASEAGEGGLEVLPFAVKHGEDMER